MLPWINDVRKTKWCVVGVKPLLYRQDCDKNWDGQKPKTDYSDINDQVVCLKNGDKMKDCFVLLLKYTYLDLMQSCIIKVY